MFDDFINRPRHFRPADVWHDAIRAEIVAAAHHPHKSLAGDVFISDGLDRFEILKFRIVVSLADIIRNAELSFVFRDRFLNQFGQLRNLSRPAHYINRIIFEQVLSQPLGHAADDAYY